MAQLVADPLPMALCSRPCVAQLVTEPLPASLCSRQCLAQLRQQFLLYARYLKRKSQQGWKAWLKTGASPANVPAAPGQLYKHEGWHRANAADTASTADACGATDGTGMQDEYPIIGSTRASNRSTIPCNARTVKHAARTTDVGTAKASDTSDGAATEDE